MIPHVHIGIADFDRAVAFCAPDLPVLGPELKLEEPQNGWAGWMSPAGHRPGGPGLRPHYHPNCYGAYFRDPDGNKPCVCCRQPGPA